MAADDFRWDGSPAPYCYNSEVASMRLFMWDRTRPRAVRVDVELLLT